MPLGDPGGVDVAGMRVVVVRENGIVPACDALAGALERAASALAKRGARVVEARLDKLARSIEMWSAMLSAAGGETFAEQMGEGKAVGGALELGRWLVGRSAHTLPAIMLTLVEKVPHLLPGRTEKMVAETLELRHDVESLIGRGGVLLFPPFPKLAPKHNRPLFAPLDFGYTAVFNVLQNPVTEVPLGLEGTGEMALPLGVQVVGVHGEDHIPIAVARVLEEIFGGWVPPAQFHGGPVTI
jgi:fatty acid amide hydrolase 2